MDYKQLAEDLVKSCLKKGADAAEVYLQSGRNLSIEVRNGQLETVEEAASQGVGFRVFVKGRMAFSNCNDLSPASLDSTIASAIEFARVTTADENNVLHDDGRVTAIEGIYDPAMGCQMDSQDRDGAEVEKLALKDPRVTKSAARLRENENEFRPTRTASRRLTSCLLFARASSSCGKGRQKSSAAVVPKAFSSPISKPPRKSPPGGARQSRMLDPRPVRTQRAAVIFDRDVASSLLGGIVGAVNGERVLQGASFLGSRLNQKIASELVTLIDDGTLPKGLASRPFDGEGFPTARRVIVEKGVLKGFMYNVIAARRAGVASTGNASRGGFFESSGIPHCFYMRRMGKRGDIIAQPIGLLLKRDRLMHQPVSGDFSAGASALDENGASPSRGPDIAERRRDAQRDRHVGATFDLSRTSTAPPSDSEMQIGGD